MMTDSLQSFVEKGILDSECNEKANRKKLYRQTYKKDWEQISLFKGWLSAVPDDKYKAVCTACNKECVAHRLSLMKHASSAKHLKKLNSIKKEAMKNPESNQRKIESKPTESIEEDSPNSNDSCNTKLVKIEDVITSVTDRDFTPDISLTHSNAGEVSFQNNMIEVPPCLIDKSPESINTSVENVSDSLSIFIHSESYIDISTSPQAINYKAGYTGNNESSLKNDTSILSCTPAFISQRIDNSHDTVALNKISTRPLQVSTRVTDYSRGVSVANLKISLYKLNSGKWTCVAEDVTDEIGRCNFFPKCNTFFAKGCYKLHYDVASYYKSQKKNLISYFPFIEISFLIESPDETHHVPLMISPNGYTAYRSLDF